MASTHMVKSSFNEPATKERHILQRYSIIHVCEIPYIEMPKFLSTIFSSVIFSFGINIICGIHVPLSYIMAGRFDYLVSANGLPMG